MKYLTAKNDIFKPHMNSDALQGLATQYFTEEVIGLSSATLAARITDMAKFIDFYKKLNGHDSVSTLMPRDVKLFIGHLHSSEYAPNSINRIVGTIRAFGTWLVENEAIRIHPCKGIKDIKVDLGPPKAPRDREYHRLLKTAHILSESDQSGFKQNYRDLVLIETLNSSGLRISEVLNIKLGQFYDCKLNRVFCKGGKVRTVSIKKRVYELIDAYIKNYRVSNSEYLFTSKNGHRLDRFTVWKSFKKIARLTSAAFNSDKQIDLSPHMLRHRHAYQCRTAKDPVFAAKRLGHSSLSYIQRYSQETEEEENDLIEGIE